VASANTQLRESEEKFRSLSENALDAIVMPTPKQNTFWNQRRAYVRYRPEESLGRSLHEILAPNGIGTRRMRATHTSQIPARDLLNRTYEFAALRKDGSEFPIELSYLVSRSMVHGMRLPSSATSPNQATCGAAEYRSTLLHAISVVAKELLTAAAIKGR